jgi:glutamate-ammonia-ligase adenylyltransferase
VTDARRQDIEAFIGSLPDPAGARTFLERLESSQPTYLNRMPLLLVSRLLIIASYSPFLGETLLLNPDHIEWLKRETERDLGRVKSAEQLSEELGRFSARVTAEDEPSRLARFKRRELLRIYLRDCLGLATLSELTEELSNLADVILTDALGAAHQEMVNRYGAPSARDQRGRIAQSEMAIVSLGKLGCRELNYASDVDLLFLYSGEGKTAGEAGRADSVIDNREFFRNVASRVVRMIGTASGEAPVYRVDLRLRPYGREGDLVWAVETAADYYRHRAHGWERQALIRARASAGSNAVVAAFFDRIRDVVFQPEPLPEALADVRRLKEKIDRQEAEKGRGFNVKLARGGIREIEFIAQALQLAYGGREPWVRSAQTLIVLARLAEKGYLSEPERSRLSSAYTFLRTVEHRLQMEHGVHTHTLPVGHERMELVARRSGYGGRPGPAAAFESDLQLHTSAVRAIYNRVFHQPAQTDEVSAAPKTSDQYIDDETERLAKQAAAAAGLLFTEASATIEIAIADALPHCINPLRSLRNFTRWAESLATYAREETGAIVAISVPRKTRLVDHLMVALSSQYLAQMIVSRPALAAAVADPQPARTKDDFLRVMKEAIDRAGDPAAKTDALRHVWYEQVVEIGYRDLAAIEWSDGDEGDPSVRQAAGSSPSPQTSLSADSPGLDKGRFTFHASLRDNNLEQTALAEASLHLAAEITLESLGLKADEGLHYAVLGLGRLGHTGMDYGSDLDLLVVFDDQAEWESSQAGTTGRTPQEFYARLTSKLVQTLSSVTREGFVYRIDLRLRPDGGSGPLAPGLGSLLTYLGTRASAWEHSAYLKCREVAGDLAFGARVREAICDAAFDAAALNPSLGKELAHVRARLEREKARGSDRNIKWGPGGMTDVYFITRYLQLRERVHFPTELGTSALIAHLGESGHLDDHSAHVLFDGYGFLRTLDHWMRLLLDRPSPVLPSSHTALGDIARALGLDSVEELEREYTRHTGLIRGTYKKIFEEG